MDCTQPTLVDVPHRPSLAVMCAEAAACSRAMERKVPAVARNSNRRGTADRRDGCTEEQRAVALAHLRAHHGKRWWAVCDLLPVIVETLGRRINPGQVGRVMGLEVGAGTVVRREVRGLAQWRLV